MGEEENRMHTGDHLPKVHMGLWETPAGAYLGTGSTEPWAMHPERVSTQGCCTEAMSTHPIVLLPSHLLPCLLRPAVQTVLGVVGKVGAGLRGEGDCPVQGGLEKVREARRGVGR